MTITEILNERVKIQIEQSNAPGRQNVQAKELKLIKILGNQWKRVSVGNW